MTHHRNQWADAQHIKNQAPVISDTFICCVCKGFTSIMGRKLASKDGNQRRWQCAGCAKGAK